eukprot:15878007-Heterocapsa_arctica.AAC.1
MGLTSSFTEQKEVGIARHALKPGPVGPNGRLASTVDRGAGWEQGRSRREPSPLTTTRPGSKTGSGSAKPAESLATSPLIWAEIAQACRSREVPDIGSPEAKT